MRKQLNVTVAPDLYARIAEQAKAENRSVSNMARIFLFEGFAARYPEDASGGPAVDVGAASSGVVPGGGARV